MSWIGFSQQRLKHNINRFRELGEIYVQRYMAKNQHWRDLNCRWHHIKTEIQVIEIIAQIQSYIWKPLSVELKCGTL